jgi:ATP-binding cassette subfamily B multidrug efflux pump
MFRRPEDLIDPFQPLVTETPPEGVWPFIRSQLPPLRGAIVASLACTLVAAVLEVWLIFYAGELVDILAATSPEQFWTEHGRSLLLAGGIVLLIRPLSWLGREGIDDIVLRPNAVTMIGWRAHRHVLNQSVGWFRNDLSGRIANRVREVGLSATGAVFTIVHTMSYVSVYVAGSIWLMASVDLRLAIPLAVWLGLYLALMLYIVPRFRQASEEYQGSQSALTGMLVDTYANIDTIKLFSDRTTVEQESRQQFGTMREAFVRLQKIEVAANAGMITLGTLLIVGLAGFSVALWRTGDAPLGLVAASLALSFRINGMAEWLLDAVASLFGYAGATRESLKTVSQPIDIPDRADAADLVVEAGEIRFNSVAHHYGKDDGGLEYVSLTIAGGEKVGIVGRSGAGKSTLVNLLLRFFDPDSGSIEIDGQDLKQVTQESLRQHIAMVPQDAALLHRSVRDNISFGRPDISQANIEAAAMNAQAHEFIPGLQDQLGNTGYDALVGERGVLLSGGQRQRIALARAFLKDAPILVLDEATSALDSEVEAAIQASLARLMQGKTVIAIAHRLSTIAHMDRIIVLDAGRIAEEGTHAQLLAADGIYAGLWARQSGGFIGE